MPFLVANVIEILDVDPEELGVEEDGAHVDLDSQRKGIVIWTRILLLKTQLPQKEPPFLRQAHMA